ncbi:hypothetical protein G7046_g5795 [Stylonectria norvegica]|nr:hypothetical protein G7046_g5795 [Stylonectria norvegica]
MSVDTDSNTTDEKTNLACLPPEILDMICGHICSHYIDSPPNQKACPPYQPSPALRALGGLASASRVLHKIAQVYMFGRIDRLDGCQIVETNLIRTLAERQDLASLVTEFRCRGHPDVGPKSHELQYLRDMGINLHLQPHDDPTFRSLVEWANAKERGGINFCTQIILCLLPQLNHLDLDCSMMGRRIPSNVGNRPIPLLANRLVRLENLGLPNNLSGVRTLVLKCNTNGMAFDSQSVLTIREGKLDENQTLPLMFWMRECRSLTNFTLDISPPLFPVVALKPAEFVSGLCGPLTENLTHTLRRLDLTMSLSDGVWAQNELLSTSKRLRRFSILEDLELKDMLIRREPGAVTFGGEPLLPVGKDDNFEVFRDTCLARVLGRSVKTLIIHASSNPTIILDMQHLAKAYTKYPNLQEVVLWVPFTEHIDGERTVADMV